jgi:hypothetical protein
MAVLFVILAAALFLFVVYLAATNQVEDFIRLVGLLFLSACGSVVLVVVIALRLAFSRLGLFIMAFTLCCFIVKWIFF